MCTHFILVGKNDNIKALNIKSRFSTNSAVLKKT